MILYRILGSAHVIDGVYLPTVMNDSCLTFELLNEEGVVNSHHLKILLTLTFGLRFKRK